MAKLLELELLLSEVLVRSMVVVCKPKDEELELVRMLGWWRGDEAIVVVVTMMYYNLRLIKSGTIPYNSGWRKVIALACSCERGFERRRW